MARHLRAEYPYTLYYLTACGTDQQTIVHNETDRTNFLTRPEQEILPQRRRSAKSSNDPTRVLPSINQKLVQCLLGFGVIGFPQKHLGRTEFLEVGVDVSLLLQNQPVFDVVVEKNSRCAIKAELGL